MVFRKTIGYIKNRKYVKSPNIEINIKQPQEHSLHRDYVRKTMATDYARDLVQPHTPEFAEAFPDKVK